MPPDSSSREHKTNLYIEYFYKLYKIYIYNIFMSCQNLYNDHWRSRFLVLLYTTYHDLVSCQILYCCILLIMILCHVRSCIVVYYLSWSCVMADLVLLYTTYHDLVSCQILYCCILLIQICHDRSCISCILLIMILCHVRSCIVVYYLSWSCVMADLVLLYTTYHDLVSCQILYCCILLIMILCHGRSCIVVYYLSWSCVMADLVLLYTTYHHVIL